MATKTQYYNLDKPSYDDVADIEVINANMDKIDKQMRNNADGVNFAEAISSDAYDNSKSYAVGDYCIYNNKLYRCITAIESAEAFNIAKWEQTTVGNEVSQLNSNLTLNTTAGYLETINPNIDCVEILGKAYIVKMGTLAILRMYFQLTMEIPKDTVLNAPVTNSFRPKNDLNNIPIDLVNTYGIGVINWKTDGVLYANQAMGAGQYKIDIPYCTN